MEGIRSNCDVVAVVVRYRLELNRTLVADSIEAKKFRTTWKLEVSVAWLLTATIFRSPHKLVG